MKKCFALAVLCALMGAVFTPAPVSAAESGRKTRDAMNLFLSNFAEAGFLGRTEAEELDYVSAVNFGVVHNLLNNRKSRIRPAKKGDPHGDSMIAVKYVEESVKKYFGVDFKADRTVSSGDEPEFFFDGKNFVFDAGLYVPEVVRYARIEDLKTLGKGRYEASGVFYNVKKPEQELADFAAVFRDSVWKGKKTYVLESIEVEDR